MASPEVWAYWRDYGRAAEVYTMPGLRERAEQRGQVFRDVSEGKRGHDYTLTRRRMFFGDVKRTGQTDVVLELKNNKGVQSWAYDLDVVTRVEQGASALSVAVLNLRKFRGATDNFSRIPEELWTPRHSREGAEVVYLPPDLFKKYGCWDDVTADFDAAYGRAHGHIPPEDLFLPSPERDDRPVPKLIRP